MKKRFFSLLICCSLFIAILPTAYAARNTSELLEESVSLISALEVIPNLEEKNMNLPVTRAEMSLAIARLIRFDDSEASSVRYFNDIAMDHWAQSAINHLAEIGVISQAPDKLFRPEDRVSFNEAVKMVVSLAGYSEYAKLGGGYPAGYINVANDHKILKGVTSDEDFTLSDAVVLLVNAFNMNIYGISGTEGGNIVYDEKDKTLFERYWDIYEAEGKVDATYGVSLVDDRFVQEDRVLVNGEVYYSPQIDMEQFIGETVHFYYRAEDTDKMEPEIISCVAPENDNDVIYVHSDDYVSYNNGLFSYYTKDGNKMKAESIPKDAVIIKNGAKVIKDVSKAYNIANGDYKLIDTDSDGSYDIVIINEAKIVKANFADIDDEIIYTENIKGESEIFKINNRDYRVILDGKNVGLEDIAKDMVLNIYETTSFIKICISAEKAVITPESLSENSIIVNGQEMDIYKEAFERYKNSIELGSIYTASIDKYNKIAFISASAVSDMTLGYIVKAKKIIDEDTDEDSVLFKIFTKDGVMLETKAAEKRITVDDVPYTDNKADVVTALTNSSGNGTVNQLVQFKCDEKGLINAIDTANQTSNESDFSLTRNSVTTYAFSTYSSSYKKIDRLGIFSSGVQFQLPLLANIPTASDDEFVVKNGAIAGNGTRFSRAETYSLNADDMNSGIAVLFAYQGALNVYPMLVNDYSSLVYDEKEGETYRVLSVCSAQEEEYYISPKYLDEFLALNLKQGDIIKIGTDTRGRVNNVDVLLSDTKIPTPGNGLMQEGVYPFAPEDHSGGKVLRKSGSVVEWGLGIDGTTPFERTSIPANYAIAVYDSSLPENSAVYMGTIDDIISAEYVGFENASCIYQFGTNGNLNRIIVHKNGWGK